MGNIREHYAELSQRAMLVDELAATSAESQVVRSGEAQNTKQSRLTKGGNDPAAWSFIEQLEQLSAEFESIGQLSEPEVKSPKVFKRSVSVIKMQEEKENNVMDTEENTSCQVQSFSETRQGVKRNSDNNSLNSPVIKNHHVVMLSNNSPASVPTSPVMINECKNGQKINEITKRFSCSNKHLISTEDDESEMDDSYVRLKKARLAFDVSAMQPNSLELIPNNIALVSPTQERSDVTENFLCKQLDDRSLNASLENLSTASSPACESSIHNGSTIITCVHSPHFSPLNLDLPTDLEPRHFTSPIYAIGSPSPLIHRQNLTNASVLTSALSVLPTVVTSTRTTSLTEAPNYHGLRAHQLPSTIQFHLQQNQYRHTLNTSITSNSSNGKFDTQAACALGPLDTLSNKKCAAARCGNLLSRNKKHKHKPTSKAKTIKFHEYKGPPNAPNTNKNTNGDSNIISNGNDASYDFLLKQQQLLLQWQLEQQQQQNKGNKGIRNENTAPPTPPDLRGLTTSPPLQQVQSPHMINPPLVQECSQLSGQNLCALKPPPAIINQTPDSCMEVACTDVNCTGGSPTNISIMTCSQPCTSLTCGNSTPCEDASCVLTNTSINNGYSSETTNSSGENRMPVENGSSTPSSSSNHTNNQLPVNNAFSNTSVPADSTGQSLSKSASTKLIPITKLQIGKLEELKVNDLKSYLKQCSLPVSGAKPILIERLKAYLLGKDVKEGTSIYSHQALTPPQTPTDENGKRMGTMQCNDQLHFATPLVTHLPSQFRLHIHNSMMHSPAPLSGPKSFGLPLATLGNGQSFAIVNNPLQLQNASTTNAFPAIVATAAAQPFPQFVLYPTTAPANPTTVNTSSSELLSPANKLFPSNCNAENTVLSSAFPPPTKNTGNTVACSTIQANIKSSIRKTIHLKQQQRQLQQLQAAQQAQLARMSKATGSSSTFFSTDTCSVISPNRSPHLNESNSLNNTTTPNLSFLQKQLQQPPKAFLQSTTCVVTNPITSQTDASNININANPDDEMSYEFDLLMEVQELADFMDSHEEEAQSRVDERMDNRVNIELSDTANQMQPEQSWRNSDWFKEQYDSTKCSKKQQSNSSLFTEPNNCTDSNSSAQKSSPAQVNRILNNLQSENDLAMGDLFEQSNFNEWLTELTNQEQNENSSLSTDAKTSSINAQTNNQSKAILTTGIATENGFTSSSQDINCDAQQVLNNSDPYLNPDSNTEMQDPFVELYFNSSNVTDDAKLTETSFDSNTQPNNGCEFDLIWDRTDFTAY